jgi:long-chain acyl-CoA synthetase
MVATVGDILPAAANRFGNRTALIFEGQTFGFADLDQKSNRIANDLAAGVRAGDRVMLNGHNCWEWLIAYYAICKTGAVVNSLNVMLTQEEVRYVIQDSGTRAVIASSDKGEPLLDMLGTSNLATVAL